MWILIDLETNEEISLISDSAYPLSELSEGEYSISIGVTDNYGAMSVVTQFFTITPSDSDGDNICDSGDTDFTGDPTGEVDAATCYYNHFDCNNDF